MRISQVLVENKNKLMEGGNLSIGAHEAEHLDLKVTNRNYMVPKLNELLNAINMAYAKMYKQPLWSPELLASGEFLSGSSLHFFNVKGIPDETFVAKKPTVGDIDTMVDKEKEPSLQEFLQKYTERKLGPAIFLGFQRGNEQFSGLFELQDPPVKVQIDFEFVKFQDNRPTDWAKFSHSSSWEDLQAGVKGVFHKWLIQAFTSLTRRDFYLRKLVGRGKLRSEQDVPTNDNMFSFAVSSKEGGGLRAKYDPVIDPATGQPLMKDGLPVMTAAPTSGYEQDIGQIFSKILGQRLNPKQAQALQKQFWSFTGLLQVMNTLLSPEEKQQVLTGFLDKTIGPGAQGMYKNNPDKDIAEKTVAINTMLKALGAKAPANLKQMLDTYRQAYKMTDDVADKQQSKDTVKDMAKNALDEAAPNYKRQGIQHIYNPGSTVEMKDLDFIDFVKEIAQDGGKFQNVPINLKVDGAGVRFGRDAQGRPFFMTSRVNEPKYIDNYGDFEAYGRSQGQSEERLNFTKNYDEALKTILTSDFMRDIPPDTIVSAEMLYNPMAKKTPDGYEFVNIPYDPAKLGREMTLVPISVKEFSTGQTRPDEAKIKKQLVKDSTEDVKLMTNTLPHKGIDVRKIVNPIIKNEEALTQALSTRGNSPDKEKAKAILSKARQALSNAIIKGDLPGKDQLGDTIEGLVINMPSGRLAKVTSPDMQTKVAAKQAANRKPTEGGNRVKPAVVTIGSFAGHKGHQQLIDQTINTAKQVGGDPYIYVSPAMGVDDPIPPADKVKTLQALYPQYAKNIQVWDPKGSPMKKIEKELVLPANSPYNKVILLVGDDRYEGMKNWMDSLEQRMKDPAALAKFGGTQNQVDFQTVRTERDPTKGGTGISFTQLRNKLKDPNASEQDKLNFWMQAFDGQKLGQQWIKHLMDVTAKNMGIQQQQAAIKEYIERIKPLLPHASVGQKAKIYESLAKAKAKLDEGAPELLKAEMPLVRHIEKELAQHGYEKGTPEYYKMFKHSIAMYRQFGNVDAIKRGMAEGFDQEEFRRHMKDLEAREELRKRDPVAAKALDLRGQLPQQSKKRPEDDSIGINDPRHPGYAYTQAGQIDEDSQIERKITRIQAMIQDYYNRSRETSNDIKRDHYIDMARQLEFELEGIINDANEQERDSNMVSQHDEQPSDTWNRGGLAEDSKEDDSFLPDPETLEIMKFAQQHYPDAKTKQQAFVKFVLHSLKHSEEDDNHQDSEILDLEKELAMLKAKVDELSSGKGNVSESLDYIEEK